MPQPVAASLVLEMLPTCLEGENEGAISSFSLFGGWFCVQMAFTSIDKGGGSGEYSQIVNSAGSMERLVPGRVLASGWLHFPKQFPGMGIKGLQSLHFDGSEGLTACSQLICAHWLICPYGCGLGVPGTICAHSRTLHRGSRALQC